MEKTLKTPATFKHYFLLTKPGIIFGNLLTAMGGFALASQGNWYAPTFLAMLQGLALIIASAAVFNNAIDKDYDAKMERTQKRALPQGLISNSSALLFGIFLGLLGAAFLLFISPLTTLIALTGALLYVVLYSYSKHRTHHATLLGSIAGAVPPLVGYSAAAGRLDLAASLLFFVVVTWQMPHFFAIAIYRLQDYRRASLPIYPHVQGIHATKVQMLLYVSLFIITTSLLTFSGYTGLLFLTLMTLAGLAWLLLALQGFTAQNDQKWARKMFFASLAIVLFLSLLLLSLH